MRRGVVSCASSKWLCHRCRGCATGAACCVNGEPIAEGVAVTLRHNDRVLLGDNTFLRYYDANCRLMPRGQIAFDWQFAYDEREGFLEAMREEEKEKVPRGSAAWSERCKLIDCCARRRRSRPLRGSTWRSSGSSWKRTCASSSGTVSSPSRRKLRTLRSACGGRR